jgi:hypothetical protein
MFDVLLLRGGNPAWTSMGGSGGGPIMTSEAESGMTPAASSSLDEPLSNEDAAAYLEVDLKRLDDLIERYGVGRHYEARKGDEFVYSKQELDRIKQGLQSAG